MSDNSVGVNGSSAADSALSPPAAARVRIRGARTHNLQDVDVDIPQHEMTVITGLSGSGKSSLALDTLLAEGQRQYVESLSVYSRQFFDKLQRPEVDVIEGLQPTVAIDQHAVSNNPRSTVATLTEIYDFLRVLMARVAEVGCPQCGAPISQQTPAEIQQAITALPPQTKVMILAPMIRGRKGQHADVIEQIRQQGFVRVRIDGVTHDLEHAPALKPQRRHDIDAVVDRVILRPDLDERLAESIRLALKHGEGALRIVYLTPEAKLAANSTDARESTSENGWLERVFSIHFACPDCRTSLDEIEPRTFSFNSPYGACPGCQGMPAREGFDADLVLPDLSLSLSAGAIAPWEGQTAAAARKSRKLLAGFLKRRQLDWETPLERWSAADREQFLRGDGREFAGLLAHLEMDFANATRETSRDRLARFRGSSVCVECGGARLCAEARACRLGGMAIHEITALNVDQALEFFDQLQFDPTQLPIGEPLCREIVKRLRFLAQVGVHYLTLDRAADTLSGGEMQRVRLATGIGSGLVGVLYILDEPSVGLHPRDTQRLVASLRQLQQQGNTVVIVEHDEEVIRQADWLIDMGPGAGSRGGRVVAEGLPQQVAQHQDSITGGYLSGRLKIAPRRNRRRVVKSRQLELRGATLNNLQNVDLELPLKLFNCVTGVSGSGKSSLVIDTLSRALARKLHGATTRPGPYRLLRGASKISRLVHVDQSPIGRTPRSNPATYTGVFDLVRRVFVASKQARQMGYKLGRFSFNTKGGRCETCQGQGVERVEMKFLPDLFVPCPACHGRQFNRQTLAVRHRGKSIADVLAMSIDEAADFFANHEAIHRMLQSMVDVGLGYLTLGQRSTTLSGGEAQRIKLAAELGRSSAAGTLYVLDEPTTGLHTDDIGRLLKVLDGLVELGNTVLVIEHNLDVIRYADWIIDMGPEGGAAGGQIVASGTPEQIAAQPHSYTGQWLKKTAAARASHATPATAMPPEKRP
jgi:excinuclease ABC subunit A